MQNRIVFLIFTFLIVCIVCITNAAIYFKNPAILWWYLPVFILFLNLRVDK